MELEFLIVKSKTTGKEVKRYSLNSSSIDYKKYLLKGVEETFPSFLYEIKIESKKFREYN